MLYATEEDPVEDIGINLDHRYTAIYGDITSDEGKVLLGIQDLIGN